MISTLYAKKDSYIVNFANSYYDEFRKVKYGIKNCRAGGKLWLDQLRFDLIDYGGDVDFCNQCYAIDLSRLKIDFSSGAGGSCNVVQKGKSYVFTQPTSSTTWVIIHNLGFVPNVFTEDENGNDIVGVVAVINNNQITITFNSPVAGTAYLS